MYTFQPLVDTSDSHVGFYIFLLLASCAIVLVIRDWLDRGISATMMVVTNVVVALMVTFGWFMSYTPDHPENIPVIGTFVSFQPEGYNEQEGKRRSDKHYMYVVYNVNGQNVILLADEGMTYPLKAILYKNKGH